MKKLTLIFTLSLIISNFSFADKKSISLVSTNWCPYACPSKKDQGKTAAKIRKVLKKMGIELKIDFYPWVRAIELVNSNQADGLLTAVKNEAPDLYFTSTPTSYYQVCFFGFKSTSWNYKTDKSFKNLKSLGYISGYSYGSIADKLIAKSNNFTEIHGSHGLQRLIKMLESGRVSTIIEDINVFNFYNKNKNIETKGCFKKEPFYIAFKKDEFLLKKVIPFLNKNL